MRIVRPVPDLPPPPSREGWPLVAVLPLEPEDVPGAEWEPYVEEGLGDARGACVEIEGGYVVSFIRYAAVPGLQVVTFVEPARAGEALDAVLRAGGLTREDLLWISPDLPDVAAG
jgi:hypothetical protein